LDPDPKLGGKWDPDPKKIVTDPQHCFLDYWDITAVCLDGKLELNRLLLGLLFPQITGTSTGTSD
jgi:hypothetical protein